MNTHEPDHAELAMQFNADEQRVNWHDETLWFIRKKRDKAAHGIAEWEELRETASQIKNHVLSHLSEYLTAFEKNALANGVQVHWAADAEEHNQIVHRILLDSKADKIVKSKSMLTEECHLNEYLQQKGIEVIDSDLGERIVQLAKERPSHIVLPCIHKKKEEIGELFHTHLGTPFGNADPQLLTQAARLHLRDIFLTRKVAITGVNFAVAETGEFVVCTNEGNADMGAHLSDVHIACMGIEKIIPQRKHLGVFLRLLTRSATGQPITTYSSHFKKPRAGQQMHLVIVDNGRSRQLGREDFRNSLKCIRCGACFNTCPVYRRSGGHSYHNAIAGPIGSILAPNLDMEQYADLPFASTLCGSCSNVCPVKIDIHQQLYKWRQVLVKNGYAPVEKKVAMRGMTFVLSHASVFRLTGKVGRWIMRYLPFVVANKMNPWYKERNMPAPHKESFTEWYKKEQKKMSRDNILKQIKTNQPPLATLIAVPEFQPLFDDNISHFIEVARTIGCDVHPVENYEQIMAIIKDSYSADVTRIITAILPLSSIADNTVNVTPHDYQNTDLYIVETSLAVAENGAVWITENDVQERVLPFITQYLAVVLHKENIVGTMHDAYKIIDDAEYGFATFIAGPSKTADIEQSLVVGAHGSKKMIVFLL